MRACGSAVACRRPRGRRRVRLDLGYRPHARGHALARLPHPARCADRTSDQRIARHCRAGRRPAEPGPRGARTCHSGSPVQWPSNRRDRPRRLESRRVHDRGHPRLGGGTPDRRDHRTPAPAMVARIRHTRQLERRRRRTRAHAVQAHPGMDRRIQPGRAAARRPPGRRLDLQLPQPRRVPRRHRGCRGARPRRRPRSVPHRPGDLPVRRDRPYPRRGHRRTRVPRSRRCSVPRWRR